MNRVSKGELKIVDYLKSKGIICVSNYSSPNFRINSMQLAFDLGFHLQDRIFLIEYNGRQWYTENCVNLNNKRNEIKQNLCEKNNYPLLTIKYDVPLSEMKVMIDNFIADNSKVKL